MENLTAANSAIKLERLIEISNRKNYKAFLYDCDGTLADNMHAHKAAYEKTAATYGITLDPALIDELAGWPTVAVATEISKRYRTSLDAKTFATEKSATFFRDYIEHTQPIPYVVEHLRQHVGKIHIGVVSGGVRRTVTKTLTVLNLIPLVDVLVCAGETPRGKPYPDPFLAAAEQLGVDPAQCLVFEDGDPGVQAAIAAGMDWVRIDQL